MRIRSFSGKTWCGMERLLNEENSMKEYAPDDSVSMLVERIRQSDLPEQDRELLVAFKDWLLEQRSAEEVARILYVWHDLLSAIEFPLETATEDQISDLQEQAPEHSTGMYSEAITLFYDMFLDEYGSLDQ